MKNGMHPSSGKTTKPQMGVSANGGRQFVENPFSVTPKDTPHLAKN
jgi:hypothetical protein